MPPIVLRLPKPRPDVGEAGFSLTELIAGLLVASLLVVGLIDLTRRFARTTDNVRTVAADERTIGLLRAAMSEIERADVGSLEVAEHDLKARVAAIPVSAQIRTTSEGTTLMWRSRALDRSFAIPSSTKFEQTPAGAVVLRATPDAPPLAIVIPRLTAPVTCLYDTVARECRQ